MCTIDDAVEAEQIVLIDPVIADLVRERYGVTDVQKQLVADPWYYGARLGAAVFLHYPSAVLSRTVCFKQKERFGLLQKDCAPHMLGRAGSIAPCI